jgi:ribosomal subunit interface protein
MKINITSRHFKANESIQNYLNDKLEALSKYHESIMHADAVLNLEANSSNSCSCELIVKLQHNLLTSKIASEDFIKSIDQAVEKIESQLLKIKDKIKSDMHNPDVTKTKTI